MKTSALAVALLTAFTSVPASATVLFSTIHTPATPNSTRLVLPNTGLPNTGPPSTDAVPRGGPIGESFYVPTATTITDVQLQLTALNPSDGASVQLFLAPDTGTGGAGVAASPTYAGSGSTLTLTGATQIGSIADSLLPSTASGTLETFNTSTPVSAGEYWLVAENTLGTGGIASAAKWVFDTTPYTAGTGTTGQEVFWQAGALTDPLTGTPEMFSDTASSTPGTNNLYLAQVDAPEPVSIAMLGVGLAGIGVARGRRRQA
jgi:hypothetical protein